DRGGSSATEQGHHAAGKPAEPDQSENRSERCVLLERQPCRRVGPEGTVGRDRPADVAESAGSPDRRRRQRGLRVRGARAGGCEELQPREDRIQRGAVVVTETDGRCNEDPRFCGGFCWGDGFFNAESADSCAPWWPALRTRPRRSARGRSIPRPSREWRP